MRLYSINSPGGRRSLELDSVSRLPGAAWSNYVRGVAAVLRTEGMALKGFDAVIHSTVPISSGLSSSAALECATATVFESVSGFASSPPRKPGCASGQEPVRGGQLRHPRPIYLLLRSGRVRLALDCRDLSSQAVPLAESIRVVICDTSTSAKWLAPNTASAARNARRALACWASVPCARFHRAILRAGEGIAA